MHRTKHSIARTGSCIARAEHLIPANDDAHQANLDAAQRELDRRAGEGEDVSHLWVNPRTYAIEPADQAERERIQADLDRDFNKGPKLARRHDAVAFDRQTGASQIRMVLGFEQREIDQHDARNLAAAWTGLNRSDLDLPKE